ncbi:MAG: hypothetical protein ACYC1I_06015 [Acidimicrobiales bacterium]
MTLTHEVKSINDATGSTFQGIEHKIPAQLEGQEFVEESNGMIILHTSSPPLNSDRSSRGAPTAQRRRSHCSAIGGECRS